MQIIAEVLSLILLASLIIETILDDVDEEYLYPSQAWASISTGLNGAIKLGGTTMPSNNFYWRDLAKNKHIA